MNPQPTNDDVVVLAWAILHNLLHGGKDERAIATLAAVIFLRDYRPSDDQLLSPNVWAALNPDEELHATGPEEG
jgi:hypothetical protein